MLIDQHSEVVFYTGFTQTKLQKLLRKQVKWENYYSTHWSI